MNSLGERIKELREQRDLSQEQLADLVGVSQSKISHCEKGVRGISFPLAIKIADALGVTTNDLVIAADEPEVEHDLVAL